jgi:uncharacterized alkaline shock family protein YloU
VAGQASISTDILARYAADAARDVVGVRGLSESAIPGRRGVRVAGDGDGVHIELHLVVDWGVSIVDVGRGVQSRVREYLRNMADVEPAVVNVVVDEIGPRQAGQDQ